MMSGAIAALCLTIAAYGAAKQAAPRLGAPLEAWAPALGAATLAILLVVYFAARRVPRAA